jgi:tagatose-6-phosphate ketose/aldose isomerase
MTDLRQTSTWAEIHSQPAIWKAWGAELDVSGLRAWIAAQNVSEVWFCGAGTSAFVGDILVSGLEGRAGHRLRAVPTTDIVARPYAFLNGQPKLIVNFGRSGNSAETLGTLAALQTLAPHWPRLNITCNAQSALANDQKARVVQLPAATHDAGFAMTSSFSTMLLTALALFDLSCASDQVLGRFETISTDLSGLLYPLQAAAFAAALPERAVFVGSGPLAFAAREAALKVMELTAGQVPTLWDSTLGFRHGPKSFVQPGTDIWVFTSSNPHTRAYDLDLITELRRQFPQSRVTVPEVPKHRDDLWSVPIYVAGAQILATVWSQALGLPVDDPFAGQGTLSRVVSGVRLHLVAPA